MAVEPGYRTMSEVRLAAGPMYDKMTFLLEDEY
jgi:hypothetical protein